LYTSIDNRTLRYTSPSCLKTGTNELISCTNIELIIL
jgi:hypothetical protein